MRHTRCLLLDSFSHWGSLWAFVIYKINIKNFCVLSTLEHNQAFVQVSFETAIATACETALQAPANGVNELPWLLLRCEFSGLGRWPTEEYKAPNAFFFPLIKPFVHCISLPTNFVDISTSQTMSSTFATSNSNAVASFDPSLFNDKVINIQVTGWDLGAVILSGDIEEWDLTEV
jgi:hypothetical protein